MRSGRVYNMAPSANGNAHRGHATRIGGALGSAGRSTGSVTMLDSGKGLQCASESLRSDVDNQIAA
jgi:hypothetical protein